MAIRRLILLMTLLFAGLLAVACSEGDEELPTPVDQATVPPTVEQTATGDEGSESTAPPANGGSTTEPTAVPPSPTPSEPLAATVNGQPIFLADYEKELARYEQAQQELGIPLEEAGDYQSQVLDVMIENQLILQAAQETGLIITPEMIDERIVSLQEQAGGAENFTEWLTANQWTEEEFRVTLPIEIATGYMVERVTSEVPATVEQVRARYIQVDDSALAQTILTELQNGADFAFLAQQHSVDRVTGENGGDLGFFARDTLLVPEVEEVAFTLQPGELSQVIEGTRADTGQPVYYIVEVLEREAERPLSDNLRYRLLQQSFESWLDNLWAQAEIVRFVGQN